MKRTITLFFTVFIIFLTSLAMAGGTVVFVIDDGKKSTLTAAEILQDYRYPATVGVVTNWIGGNGMLTVDNLRYLYSEGWEIANHTDIHPHFNNMANGEVLISVKNASDMIEEWGFPRPVSLINPYGEGFEGNRMENIFSKTSISICRRAYPENINDIETMVNRRLIDPWGIKVFSLRKATVGTDWQNIPEIFYDLIYQAREECALVVFVVHEVTNNFNLEYNILPRMLEDMVNYISRQPGVEVLTLKDGVEKTLNVKDNCLIETIYDEDEPIVCDDADENSTETSANAKVNYFGNEQNQSSISKTGTAETGEATSETTVKEDDEEEISPPRNIVVEESDDSGGGCFIRSLE